jgi:hypothetical protein
VSPVKYELVFISQNTEYFKMDKDDAEPRTENDKLLY